MKFLGSDILRVIDSVSAFATAASGSSGGSLDLTVADATPPATPAARLFRQDIAGRQFPAVIGPVGRENSLQPLIARNKIGIWCPQGNSITPPGSFGFTGYTTLGTIVARLVSTGSFLGRLRRIGYTSATTAASFAHSRVNAAQITTGDIINGVAVGGFFKVIRFGISDPATVPSARMFIGINGSISSPVNVEPATLVNHIGVGHGASDASLRFYCSGDTAQTAIDLGAAFPATTGATYELALYCAAGSLDVHWQVTRLDIPGAPATGLVTGVAGVTVPAPSLLLTYSNNWRTNNTSSLSVGFDICSDYIETET